MEPHLEAIDVTEDDEPEFMQRLRLTMEYEVIRSLMSGNDVQCFTTQDYVEARDRWIEKFCGYSRESLGIGPIDDSQLRCARNQLMAVPNLVRQVHPHVWTYAETISGAVS